MNVAGQNVVVTGKIAGESRASAEQKLREAGASVQSSVTSSTDLLVTGAKVGKTKIDKAEALGVKVVSWESLQGDPPVMADGAFTAPARKPKALSERQIGPMLAKAGELPKGEGWQFEIKWDGYRCVATVRGGGVAMQSRSGKSDYAEQFPAIAAALAGLPDCVIDGELVVLDDNGHSSIESLGNGGAANARFILFDALELDGEDLRPLPLHERRERLEAFLNLKAVGTVKRRRALALSPAWDDGEKLLAYVAERGLEGVVAKRLQSFYREGSRAGEWVKTKVRNEQEFVVVGWLPGKGQLEGQVGGLLLAVHNEDGELVYVGRTGVGGTDEERAAFEANDMPAERKQLLAIDGIKKAEQKDVTWVEPTLVIQVAFQNWTKDGRLWHPVMTGVRRDKDARDVVRET